MQGGFVLTIASIWGTNARWTGALIPMAMELKLKGLQCRNSNGVTVGSPSQWKSSSSKIVKNLDVVWRLLTNTSLIFFNIGETRKKKNEGEPDEIIIRTEKPEKN